MGRTASVQREYSGAMALVNNRGSSYSPPDGTPPHNLEQSYHDGRPQGNSGGKNTPFSISAILSEDVGRKRPLASSTAGAKGKKPRLSESGPGMEGGGCVSPVGSGASTISLSQAGTLVLSPGQAYPQRLQGYSLPVPVMYHGSVASTSLPAPVLHAVTPRRSLNSSLSASPFNASMLSALGHQQTPGPQEDVFTDSLGMLSTVAIYHSELSNRSGLSCATPVHERIEAMRIASSSSEQFDGSQTMSSCSSSDSTAERKASTPYILKRDKRRRRQSSSESSSDHSQRPPQTMEDPATHLNTGFLSPTHKEPSLHQQQAFSPSIFLRRPPEPERASSTSVLSNLDHSSVATSILTASPTSEGEHVTSVSGGVGASNSFITSTPIKGNVQSSSLVAGTSLLVSPRQPQASGWGQHFRDTNETSSSSDTEQPVRRARRLPKKSRARTKLSPLLETACSPIAKSRPPQPSSLLAANFVPTPAITFPVPMLSPRTSHGFPPPQTTDQERTIQQPSTDVPSSTRYPTSNPTPQLSLQPTPQRYPPYFYPCTTGHQLFPPHCHPSHNPLSHNAMAASGSRWPGSSVAAGWDCSGQIQCVPPRFIFAQNQSEGKRSRLTEAINRSLTETPSENPRLPAEWTKYACGQTADQKDLTQKAKSFLQCRPRQLTFEGMK